MDFLLCFKVVHLRQEHVRVSLEMGHNKVQIPYTLWYIHMHTLFPQILSFPWEQKNFHYPHFIRNISRDAIPKAQIYKGPLSITREKKPRQL